MEVPPPAHIMRRALFENLAVDYKQTKRHSASIYMRSLACEIKVLDPEEL